MEVAEVVARPETEPDLEPLHVVIDKPSGEKDVAADWGSWQTYTASPSTPPQQILPQNNRRKESEIIVQQGLGGLASINNSGTAAAPMTAGQQVTSVTLQPGIYTVSWNISLTGTSSATDGSNMQLMLNGVPLLQSSNGSTTVTVYPQPSVTVQVTQPNSILSINAINTPTSTCGYRGALTASPTAGTGFVRVGTRAQIMNNQGGQLGVGRYPFEAKQELWMGSDGSSTMTVTVLDERYE